MYLKYTRSGINNAVVAPLTQHKPVTELFGLRAAPRNARGRLLDTAIDLFYVQGFNAVGLDQILAATGVTKTTFYKHFDSKDDLIVAAIEKRNEWEHRAWQKALKKLAGNDPRAQLLAMFDVLDHWFNDPDFHGCIFINAASEFPNPHDPAHQAAAAHKHRERDTLRHLAKKAGAADPRTFADQYTLLIEGTLVMRQVHGRDDAARIARHLAERLVDEHIPPR